MPSTSVFAADVKVALSFSTLQYSSIKMCGDVRVNLALVELDILFALSVESPLAEVEVLVFLMVEVDIFALRVESTVSCGNRAVELLVLGPVLLTVIDAATRAGDVDGLEVEILVFPTELLPATAEAVVVGLEMLVLLTAVIPAPATEGAVIGLDWRSEVMKVRV